MGLHDANGARTQGGFDTFFGEGEYFSAVDFGVFPGEGDEDSGLWHVTFWNVDGRENADRSSDHGIALTIENEFGPRNSVVPFFATLTPIGA